MANATKFITTRSGKVEEICMDKITDRLRGLCEGLNLTYVNPQLVAFETIPLLAAKDITTKILDEQSARLANDMIFQHTDYSLLAGRIIASNLQKNIKLSFSETASLMYHKTYPLRTVRRNKKRNRRGDTEAEPLPDPRLNGPGLHLTENVYRFIQKHKEVLNAAIKPERDFQYDYFAIRTFLKSYLFQLDGVTIETIQYLFMRVACSLWCGDLNGDRASLSDALDTYDLLSTRKGTNATPSLMNLGSYKSGTASCFGLYVGDSLVQIMDSFTDVTFHSKGAGGLGVDFSDLRAVGQPIHSTNGISGGLIPATQVLQSLVLWISQGGGKRNGSAAVYVEVSHPEIIEVMTSKMEHSGAKNNVVATKTGLDVHQQRERAVEDKKSMAETDTAQSLFYAAWCPDMLFFRYIMNEDWTMISPDEAPDLHHIYGREYNDRYLEYEQMSDEELPSRKTINAREMFRVFFTSSSNTGTPYAHAKDTINARNTVKNVDPILQSNLCCEIVQPSGPDETFVCNLASICLPAHVKRDPTTGKRYFDFEDFMNTVKSFTSNVNRLIDQMTPSSVKAGRSNSRYRPMALGVQGLADVFLMLRLSYTSDEARALDRDIAEGMELAAMWRSNELGIEAQESFEGFEDSELAKGRFQHDLAYEHMESRYHEMIRLCKTDRQRHILMNEFGWPRPKKEDYEPRRFAKEYAELKQRLTTKGTNFMRNAFWVGYMPTATTSSLNANTESFEPITGVVMRRSTGAGDFFIINKYFVEEMVELGLWNEDLAFDICNEKGSVQNIPSVPQWLKDIYKTRFEYDADVLDIMNAQRQTFIDQACSYNFYSKKLRLVDYTRHMLRAWKAGVKTIHYYTRTLPAYKPQQYKLTPSTTSSTISIPVPSINSQKPNDDVVADNVVDHNDDIVPTTSKKLRMAALPFTAIQRGSCTNDVCEA